MSNGKAQAGHMQQPARGAPTDAPPPSCLGDRNAQVWPILVGREEDPGPIQQHRSYVSLNTKAFLTMGGTGLATAFFLSPLILLLDGMTLQTYVILSCLMAVASFTAGLVNYHIVLSGTHGIVKKVSAAAGLVPDQDATEGKRRLNHGDIDTMQNLFDELLHKVHLDMETRLRVEQDSLLSAITSLAVALEARDPYTRSHSRNVAHSSAKLANRMGLSEAEVDEIHLAGQLHDIGKIGVRDEVLLKPGTLTHDEFGEIKRHPELSSAILKPFRHLDNIRIAIRHHHEKMNGSGYPDGLNGEQIPIGARIMAVVDAFDAMTSDRPYRPARSLEDTVDELRRMGGSLLDPDCVRAFLEMLEEDPEFADMTLAQSA